MMAGFSADQAASSIVNHLQTGFSSASRLYDLGIEGVQGTPAHQQLAARALCPARPSWSRLGAG